MPSFRLKFGISELLELGNACHVLHSIAYSTGYDTDLKTKLGMDHGRTDWRLILMALGTVDKSHDRIGMELTSTPTRSC